MRLRALPLLIVAATGCASLAAPRYHGPPSDHFDGERFHNYARFHDRQIEDALRLELHALTGKRGFWAGWEDVPTDTPPPRIGAGALRVTFVNHSTLLIQTDGLNVLTDPIWSKRASPVSWTGPKRHRPPGIRFEDLPPIDLVVVSHDHYDHMDLPTLQRLARTFHPRIVTGLGNARYLARHGVPGAEEVDWWQSVTIAPGVRLTGVPAQHWSARSLDDKWRTLWLGFVLEGPSGAVYFAGDTGLGEFFPAIRDRFPRFRLAILPIAPARPRAAMAPRHLSAADAVRADTPLDSCDSKPLAEEAAKNDLRQHARREPGRPVTGGSHEDRPGCWRDQVGLDAGGSLRVPGERSIAGTGARRVPARHECHRFRRAARIRHHLLEPLPVLLARPAQGAWG